VRTWKDSPEQSLDPFGLEAQSPDTFLLHLHDLDPGRMVRILIEQADDLKAPPMTVPEVLDQISLQAPQFALLVRNSAALSRSRLCG